MLEDFPEDEPENDEIVILSCPVRYNNDSSEDGNTDPVLSSFRREMASMRPWYDIAVNKRKRTTVGVSKMKLEDIPDFLYAFIKGEIPESPRKEFAPGYLLKLAVEDMKAYYIEAVTAQPGQSRTSARKLQEWFWDETAAGKFILSLKKACESSNDKMLNMMGAHFLIPGDVVRRQGR